MDNKISCCLEYLISTVPADGNSLFKIIIIVVVGCFAIRLMRRFLPDFLFMISNYLKLILLFEGPWGELGLQQLPRAGGSNHRLPFVRLNAI